MTHSHLLCVNNCGMDHNGYKVDKTEPSADPERAYSSLGDKSVLLK